MKRIKPNYTPDICECCGQTTTYLLAIDKGTAEIVKAVARYIGQKGINAVHCGKEMETEGLLTSNQVDNLTRPQKHGLLARVPGNPGNYLLTRKGSDFLHGKPVPRFVIVQKGRAEERAHTLGYFEPEKYTVTINDFNSTEPGEYWEGINYEVREGEVIHTLPPKDGKLF